VDEFFVVSRCQVIHVAFDLVVRPDQHVVVVLRNTAFVAREELLLTRRHLLFLCLHLILFNLSSSVLLSPQLLIFSFLGSKLAHFCLLFNEA